MQKWIFCAPTYGISGNDRCALVRRNRSDSAIYDTASGKRIARLPYYEIFCGTFLPDGKLLLRTGQMLYAVWDIEASAEIWRWQYPLPARSYFSNEPFLRLSDGRLLDVTPYDGNALLSARSVFCLDSMSGQIIPVVKENGKPLEEGLLQYSPGIDTVWCDALHRSMCLYRIDPHSMTAAEVRWVPRVPYPTYQDSLQYHTARYIDTRGRIWYTRTEEPREYGKKQPIWIVREGLPGTPDEEMPPLRIPPLEAEEPLGFSKPDCWISASGRYIALKYNALSEGRLVGALRVYDAEAEQDVELPDFSGRRTSVEGWIGETLFVCVETGEPIRTVEDWKKKHGTHTHTIYKLSFDK